jgi:protein SCO1/2
MGSICIHPRLDRFAGLMLAGVAAAWACAQQAPVNSGAVANDAKTAVSSPSPASEADPEKGARLPNDIKGLMIDEHLGLPLPMELQFTTSDGRKVQLGDYFKSNKPAVIAMVYYKCPVVCDVVMQKMTESFNGIDFTVGKDFNCLLFSFDSTETPAEAKSSKTGHLSNYTKPVTAEVEQGWQFHVGDTDSSRQLANAIGFKYRRLANGQFGHPTAIYVITPEGRISRYFYGFDYPSRDMKLALIDATNGKLVKTIGDRIMSYCYMFDPNSGKYTLMAMRVMQVSGAISAACVAGLVGALFLGERVRRRVRGISVHQPPQPAGGAA